MTLEAKRLDEIGGGEIDALEARLLAVLRPKTVNNVLAVLGRMLRWAHELGLIDRVPRIKLVKVPPQGLAGPFISFFPVRFRSASSSWATCGQHSRSRGWRPQMMKEFGLRDREAGPQWLASAIGPRHVSF